MLCGQRSVAEDLVQDTFLEVHRRWSVVADYDNPGAWARRVLVNKSTSRGRRLIVEARGLARLAGRRQRQNTPELPDDEIWHAVRALPRRQAQAIALRYWDDLSVAEIAEILDCGVETVRTHLRRGRATLGQAFDEEVTDDDR